MPDRNPPAGRVEWVEETGSTSADLRARAEAGVGEMALGARRQTTGRGRLGRAWWSGEGNLALSVLMRPGRVVVPGHWSLLAGVALAEAVLVHAGKREIRLKWPNDVMLDGGKLGGILVEMGDRWLVLGFGVNLVAAPEGLGRAVACLDGPGPEAFAAELLARLGAWRGRYEAEGFGAVRAGWMRFGPELGVQLTIDGVEGLFAGLREDGALLLEVGGRVSAYLTGDVQGSPVTRVCGRV